MCLHACLNMVLCKCGGAVAGNNNITASTAEVPPSALWGCGKMSLFRRADSLCLEQFGSDAEWSYHSWYRRLGRSVPASDVFLLPPSDPLNPLDHRLSRQLAPCPSSVNPEISPLLFLQASTPQHPSIQIFIEVPPLDTSRLSGFYLKHWTLPCPSVGQGFFSLQQQILKT